MSKSPADTTLGHHASAHSRPADLRADITVKAGADFAARRELAAHKVANRLRRARGQLDAVIESVESGGKCKDVVTQLAAVSSALDKAGFAIIASAMRDCVDLSSSSDEHPDGLTVDELERLFLTLA
jgi:DNA-binding FrmR family transcriptional regulator